MRLWFWGLVVAPGSLIPCGRKPRLPNVFRAPGEESPDTTGHDAARASPQVRAPCLKAWRRKVLQKLKPPAGDLGFHPARVKRWGKSPPRRKQWRRHEKPHRVQGKIGNWAARPIVAGMPHPASAGRLRERVREMTTEAPQGVEHNPAYRPQNQIRRRHSCVLGRTHCHPSPGLKLD